MNKYVALTSIIALLAASSVYFNQDQSLGLNTDIPSEIVVAFDQWKLSQKRLYSTPQEQSHRLRVFYENYKLVEEVNSKKLSYTFGLNAFSDVSDEEFNAKYLQKPQTVETPSQESLAAENAEQIFSERLGQTTDNNWCSKSGVCSAVRDQKSCAAGYAFAAAKGIEYPNNIRGRSSAKWLSPQELVDCSGNFGNKACDGGYPSFSMKYAMQYGLNFDVNYPYKGLQQTCKGTSGLFPPGNFLQVNRDLNSFTKILDQTPFTVGLDARSFKNYRSGIFYGVNCSTSTVTHFMTLIGYGILATNESYWRLENSWGTSWGQGGYMFLGVNDKGNTNVCGILNVGVASLLKP